MKEYALVGRPVLLLEHYATPSSEVVIADAGSWSGSRRYVMFQWNLHKTGQTSLSLAVEDHGKLWVFA